MQQDQRRSCPPFHVVEANTFHGNDPPGGRAERANYRFFFFAKITFQLSL
jgi:hypothetical protein